HPTEAARLTSSPALLTSPVGVAGEVRAVAGPVRAADLAFSSARDAATTAARDLTRGARVVRAARLSLAAAASATSVGAGAGQDGACLAVGDTNIVHAAAAACTCCCCTARFSRSPTRGTHVVAAKRVGIAGRSGSATSLARASAVMSGAAGVTEQCRAKNGGEKT